MSVILVQVILRAEFVCAECLDPEACGPLRGEQTLLATVQADGAWREEPGSRGSAPGDPWCVPDVSLSWGASLGCWLDSSEAALRSFCGGEISKRSG